MAQEALAGYERQDPAIPVMPADVMKLLNRCFQQQPEDRPTTMLEVATELQAIYARCVGRPYSRAMPKSHGTGASDLVNRGHSLNALGRREEALVAFEQAIHLNPNKAETYNQQGVTLGDLGRREEALVSYKQAIRLDPNHAIAYYNRGVALEDLGRREEALVSYEQASRLDSNDVKAHTNRGLVLQELGRPEEALVAFEQAIRLNPNHASAYLAYRGRGVALVALGRIEEGLAAIEQALDLHPNYADNKPEGVIFAKREEQPHLAQGTPKMPMPQPFPVDHLRLLHTLTGHTGYVSRLAISPDGRTLVSGGGYNDKTIRIWDLVQGKEVHTLSGHDRAGITSLVISPDGQTLVSGTGGRTIRIWDLAQGKEVHTLSGHGTSSLAISPDSQTLVSGSFLKTVIIWGV